MANAGTAFFQFKISTIVRASIVFPALRAAVSATLAVAPGWLARTAARHFVTPPQHGYTNSEILALKNARHRQVASPMGKLAVWQFGDQWRPVVVFSHGWGGAGHNSGSLCLHLLALVFRYGFSIMLVMV